ncbi:hypothetical protein [Nocardia arthritidis]|uniref:Uncharacterized protein n=1 Tax=Nocardia arthritidis TaxID=228602 RepID=A0A6G9YAV2_9NOCA|nr:hypothetical protein [Nocardia arthritidis]QIS10359.1 hypothetical protein F5544_12340 [Nocardia arthritidis]
MGAVLAFLGGLIAAVIGVYDAFQDPGATPTCDGKPMVPHTECVEYKNGQRVSVTSYEQAVKDQHDSRDKGIGMLEVAGGLLVGSVVVFFGSARIGERLLKTAEPQPAPLPAPQLPTAATKEMPALAKPALAPTKQLPAIATHDDYRQLLTMVMGNPTTADRLIEYERRKSPTADRDTLITSAIEQLRRDRERQG